MVFKINILILFLFPVFMIGQNITIEADTLLINIGQPINLVVKSSENLSKNDIQFSKNIEVISKSKTHSNFLKITSFKEGKIDLFAFIVLGKDTLKSNILSINVNEIDLTQRKDIYDIKEVFWLRYSLKEIILFVVGIFLLIAILFFVLKKIKGKKELPKEIEEVVKIQKTPKQKALERFKELDSKDFLQNGQSKLYYTYLEDIIRFYLLEKYAILAKEMTTSEIVQSLENNMIFDRENRDIVSNFLNISDFVKFAKMSAQISETKIFRDKIEQIIIENEDKLIQKNSENV